MGEPQSPPSQFIPRFRTDVYPFIYPEKFRGALKDRVTIITGKSAYHSFPCWARIGCDNGGG